jgi:hypothetical protein
MRHRELFPLLLLLSPSLPAQAWLSPQGDGTVSVLYQNGITHLHAYGDRTKDRGPTYFDGAVFSSDYSLTDRLAVSVSLPFIEAKYAGSFPHVLVRGDSSTAVAIGQWRFSWRIPRLSPERGLRRHRWR